MDTGEKLEEVPQNENGFEELRTFNGMREGTVPEYGRVLHKADRNIHDTRVKIYQTVRFLFNRLFDHRTS
jgi:hypothetical protein